MKLNILILAATLGLFFVGHQLGAESAQNIFDRQELVFCKIADIECCDKCSVWTAGNMHQCGRKWGLCTDPGGLCVVNPEDVTTTCHNVCWDSCAWCGI